MKKSRKFIADSGFQLKLSAGIIVITTITVSVFIGLIIWSSNSNTGKLNIVVENQNVMSRNQNELLKTMLILSDKTKRDSINITTSAIEKDIEDNKVRTDKNNALIAEIGGQNSQLVMILIICVAVQSIALFFFLIRRTNRISGPLVVLNRYITEIREGKIPDVRPLRPKDDLKNLFENFRQMVKGLKK